MPEDAGAKPAETNQTGGGGEKTDFYVRSVQRALKEAQTREASDTVRADELCPRHISLAIDGFNSQGLWAHQAASEASLQLLHAWKNYKSRDVDGALIIARAEFVDTIGRSIYKFPHSSQVAALALPLLARLAAVHDNSRAAGRALIPTVVAALRNHPDNQDVQMGGYQLLIELCRDKELAQDRAVEAGAFPVIVQALRNPTGSAQQRCTLFRLLAWLCRQELHARAAFDAGLVPPLAADLKRHVTEVAVLEAACYAVDRLAREPSCRSAAVAEGIVESISSGMNSAVHDAGTQIQACDALCNLAGDNETAQKMVVKGALEATTFYALQSFRDNAEVQQAGCRTLRTLLERTGAAAAQRLRVINADELLWMALTMYQGVPEVVEHAGEALALVLASETKLEAAVFAGVPAAIEAAGKQYPRDSGVQMSVAKVARLLAGSQSSKTAASVAGAAKVVFLQLGAFPAEWEVLETACNALAAMAQSKAAATRAAVEALMGEDGAAVQKVAQCCRAWISTPKVLVAGLRLIKTLLMFPGPNERTVYVANTANLQELCEKVLDRYDNVAEAHPAEKRAAAAAQGIVAFVAEVEQKLKGAGAKRGAGTGGGAGAAQARAASLGGAAGPGAGAGAPGAGRGADGHAASTSSSPSAAAPAASKAGAARAGSVNAPSNPMGSFRVVDVDIAALLGGAGSGKISRGAAASASPSVETSSAAAQAEALMRLWEARGGPPGDGAAGRAVERVAAGHSLGGGGGSSGQQRLRVALPPSSLSTGASGLSPEVANAFMMQRAMSTDTMLRLAAMTTTEKEKGATTGKAGAAADGGGKHDKAKRRTVSPEPHRKKGLANLLSLFKS